MPEDPGCASAISIEVAGDFIDAVAALMAQLPAELVTECSSLADALAEERTWCSILANVPLVLIVGNESAVTPMIFTGILGAQGLPSQAGVLLIAQTPPRGQWHQNIHFAEFCSPPGNAVFGRQILYVPDLQRFARDFPAAARSLLNWCCIVAVIATESPDWLDECDAASVLLWSSSTIGRVSVTRVGRGVAPGAPTDVEAAELLQHIEGVMDHDAWQRCVLRLFQRLATPISEAREAMAWERIRVAKLVRDIERALEDTVSSLQRRTDALVEAVSRALVSTSVEVWSKLSDSVERSVSVERRRVLIPPSQKSWFHKLLEGVFGEIGREERIERVSYEVSAHIVEEFRNTVHTRLENSMPWHTEIAPTCCEIETELASRISAATGQTGRDPTRPPPETRQALGDLLAGCREEIRSSALTFLAELPCRTRRFTSADIGGGLARVVEERLHDSPIRNPIRGRMGDMMEPSVESMVPVLSELRQAQERLVRLEEEARQLMDLSGTLELAAQDDLRSSISRVRRAARATLERGGRTDTAASSLLRALARMLGD